jgi:N utilization substance protein B
MAKKNAAAVWTPELPPPEFSQTRSAACAWFYATHFYADQDVDSLRPLLAECYPLANLSVAEDIVRGRAPFHDVSEELIHEVTEMTHTDGYELLPWRESAIRMLAIDFLSTLKSSSSQISEDCIQRITSVLDDRLRGTTKNACQILSGQRTRLRKTVRSLIVAILYESHYRPAASEETLLSDAMELVLHYTDPEFIQSNFPFDDYLNADNSLNARGRFAFCESMKTVHNILTHKPELDELIQASSKRWRISRMSIVDLNILRMATYELFIERLSPPRILINEAVELAKVFGAEQSKNFVNGILQQLCNDNHIDVG